MTVGCYPLPDFVPEAILKSVGTAAVFDHTGAKEGPNCFVVEYRNRLGQLIHESRRLGTERHGTFY